MDLIARRTEIIAEHKAMEKYHPHWKTVTVQPLSERPIAFLCDDEIVVVGPCVVKVLAGLKAFLARSKEFEDRANREPAVAQALAKAAKAVRDVSQQIRVSQQSWNAYLFALGEVGLEVVLTDGSDHGGPAEVAGVQGPTKSGQ